jgi:predicted DNA-binding transcriptional regulator YafY
MRRADRLLQIIQLFRRKRGPVTASAIAEELEVTIRTIYRDIASLMANGVPIRGEAGIGYVLDQAYDLPPLMFSADELEALMLGARMVAGQGDAKLTRSADNAIAKIAAVVPPELRPVLLDAPLYAPVPVSDIVDQVDAGLIRTAIRERRKVHIDYMDAQGSLSERAIWPVAIAYYHGLRLLVAWCELRNDFRNFRVDRIRALTILAEKIPERREILFRRWWEQETSKRDGNELR